MDKLKQILKPGHKDEQKYGDEETRQKESVGASTTEPENTAPLRTTEAGKKEHGILRQILNPGGQKYDSQAYGENATTAPVPEGNLVTNDGLEKKDQTVLRQIVNPGGEKYDELAYGSNAHATGDLPVATSGTATLPVVGAEDKLLTDPEQKKHEHSVLRQILNPGGAKYDQEAYGTTAHVADADAIAKQEQLEKKDHSVTRQILNPGGAKYDETIHGAPVTSESHVGRDAALAGAGGAAAGTVLAAHEHEKKEEHSTAAPSTTATTGASPITTWAPAYSTVPAPSVPAEVAASQVQASTAPEAAANPVAVEEKSAVEQELLAKVPEAQAGTSSAPVAAAPIVAPASQSTTSALGQSGINEESHIASDPSLGAEAAAAVAGAGVAGGAVTAHEQHKTATDPAAAPTQINKPTGANDVEAATYTYSSTPVGIGASTTQADANSIANLSARPQSDGISGDAPSTGVLHGQAIHEAETAGTAAGVGALAGGAAASQLNHPRANNDIADATHVERSYPVGTATTTSTATPVEGYLHHTQGPHPTDAGNRLDPAVQDMPGAFPVTPLAGPNSTGGIGGGELAGAGAAAGVAGLTGATVAHHEDNKSAPIQTTTNTSGSTSAVPTDAVTAGAASATSSGVPETFPSATSAAHTQPVTSAPVAETETSAPAGSATAAHDHSAAEGAALGAGAVGAGAAAVYSSEPHQSDKHERKLQEAREEVAEHGGDHGEKEKKKHGLLYKILHPGHKNKDKEDDKAAETADAGIDPSTHTAAATAADTAIAGSAVPATEKSTTTSSGKADAGIDPSTHTNAAIAADTAIAGSAHPTTEKSTAAPVEKSNAGIDPSTHTAAASAADAALHGKSGNSSTAPVSSLDPAADKAGVVIQPHTGLPMDPAKYGTDGAGGTDGAPQIKGYDHATVAAQQAYNPTIGQPAPLDNASATGPDWEAIKKANTPY